MSFTIHQGDVIEELGKLPSDSVHCVVTSPPYWGLRDYGIEPSVWGGLPACAHQWGGQERGRRGDILPAEVSEAGRLGTHDKQAGLNDGGRFCALCGAWRGCLGLEPTPDLFIEHMVVVFRHVRRVLHHSGTLWLNMGDCYVTSPHGAGATNDPKYAAGRDRSEGRSGCNRTDSPAELGLKSKDLCMVPARVALALQADGWYLRSQIPWLKKNGMPGSQMDRPTTMVEYVYLFSKEESYFYDREACRVESSSNTHSRGLGVNPKSVGPHSRIHCDRDPRHQTAAKIRAKQNRSFSAAVCSLVPDRVRRDADWFFESWQGLLIDEAGDPLALVVNPQSFALEMCGQCGTIYDTRRYRRLSKVCADCDAPLDELKACICGCSTARRVCECGAKDWISHFATFPERLVEPFVLLGASAYGCCHHCGAPYERVLERAKVGDWNPNAKRGHDKTVVAHMANWTKLDREPRLVSKASPEGSQFAAMCMEANTKAARAAGKHAGSDPAIRNGDKLNTTFTTASHDQPFTPPRMLGWRPSCSHPLFPPEPVPCTVLDPFSGSGRSGLVAVRHGLNYVGIERNPNYVRMSLWQYERIAGAAVQGAVEVAV